MKEIVEILAAVSRLGENDNAVLATVVEVRGSGYRLPGARMLVLADGTTVGSVSGGCLEADVIERAKKVLKTSKPEVFTYDTTAEEDSVFSLNMGCRGVMRILIEPVGRESEIVSRLSSVYRERNRIAVACVIDPRETEFTVGERVFVSEDGVNDLAGGLNTAIPQLRDDLVTFCGAASVFETIDYETGRGLVEIAFESLLPPIRLTILGAGADAVPLAAIATQIGWTVDIYDHRPAFLRPERFAAAVKLIELDRDVPPLVATDARTAIVTMNHNYDRDKALLAEALRSDAFYIGALGPKKRTTQMLDEIGSDRTQMEKLYSPAGLDVGGDSPETIAISIIAEIQSVLKHRAGGSLRDRQGSIYGRS